jgi:hypothetical protein
MMKLTRTDRIDLGTSQVARRYLTHLAHSQDHHLTDAEARRLRAAERVLAKMEKRIENGIEP